MDKHFILQESSLSKDNKIICSRNISQHGKTKLTVKIAQEIAPTMGNKQFCSIQGPYHGK